MRAPWQQCCNLRPRLCSAGLLSHAAEVGYVTFVMRLEQQRRWDIVRLHYPLAQLQASPPC